MLSDWLTANKPEGNTTRNTEQVSTGRCCDVPYTVIDREHRRREATEGGDIADTLSVEELTRPLSISLVLGIFLTTDGDRRKALAQEPVSDLDPQPVGHTLISHPNLGVIGSAA